MTGTRIGTALVALAAMALPVSAADTLVLGLQESGTVLWEIAAIRALELDTAHDVTLEVRGLADSRAGQIALQTGAVDVILSDFLWVSAQRDAGTAVTMVPHSLAVGGVMVPADSDIDSVPALKGHTIAVAGGPADKSWVILQALYRHETGGTLADEASARFGAPPLVNELLASGGVDAGLNFWHWNARAKAAGMVELVSVEAMFVALGIDETPPLLGWTFTEATAETKGEVLRRFLDASFAAKAALAADDGLWETIRPEMGVGEDDALFAQLRDDYRSGIVMGYDPDDVAAAARAFALLAAEGGSEVVGTGTALSAGTFWSGYRK